MNLYARLYESTLEYCARSGFSPGLVYTVAMLALGLGIALTLLSGINVLWALRWLHHPYTSGAQLHPEHYVYALLSAGFVANTILARIKFSADRRCLCLAPDDPSLMPDMTAPAMAGPACVLGSAVLFGVTLAVGLLTHR